MSRQQSFNSYVTRVTSSIIHKHCHPASFPLTAFLCPVRAQQLEAVQLRGHVWSDRSQPCFYKHYYAAGPVFPLVPGQRHKLVHLNGRDLTFPMLMDGRTDLYLLLLALQTAPAWLPRLLLFSSRGTSGVSWGCTTSTERQKLVPTVNNSAMAAYGISRHGRKQ